MQFKCINGVIKCVPREILLGASAVRRIFIEYFLMGSLIVLVWCNKLNRTRFTAPPLLKFLS